MIHLIEFETMVKNSTSSHDPLKDPEENFYCLGFRVSIGFQVLAGYLNKMTAENSNDAKRYYVYMLSCADTSYYLGSTNDLKKRLRTHNDGRGAKYTRSRRPVRLVYHEIYPNKSEALRRERELKSWNRAQKHTLLINKK